MTIPKYETIMLPLLQLVRDEKEHRIQDLYVQVEDHFELTDKERQQPKPSGTGRVIRNRTQWAKLYLLKAGLIESPQRGVFRITKRGLDVLLRSPDQIDNSMLRKFPKFVEFTRPKERPAPGADAPEQLDEKQTPDEILESAHERLLRMLASEVLTEVKNASPAFFENLVVDLLRGMGYGGSNEDAGEVLGRSGDCGIDGTIQEDRLGLEVIYIQAKRWEGSVGRPEIQKFVGALHGKKARKGVFITTSSFTKDAQDYVDSVENKVVLIDGHRLADLMISFDVGVSTIKTYTRKRLDTDYFVEE